MLQGRENSICPVSGKEGVWCPQRTARSCRIRRLRLCERVKGGIGDRQSPGHKRSVNYISCILVFILKVIEGSLKGLKQEKDVVRFPRHKDHIGPFWEA